MVDLTVRQKAALALKKALPKKELGRILKKLLSDLGCEDAEVSVLITDDREIAKLNGEYRNKPKPTDVLSFALRDSTHPQAEHGHLGDLIISIETAKRQAKQYEVSLKEELIRLVVHGTLHLLGYDHEGVPPGEAAKMRRMEKKLFLEITAEQIKIY